MFSLEQLEKARKKYEKEIKDFKTLLKKSNDEKDLYLVETEVLRRCPKTSEQIEKCNNDIKTNEEALERVNSDIVEFSQEIRNLKLELETLNKMIDEIKNDQHLE